MKCYNLYLNVHLKFHVILCVEFQEGGGRMCNVGFKDMVLECEAGSPFYHKADATECTFHYVKGK